MSIRKCSSWQISTFVSMLLLTTIQPLTAQTPSDSQRLEKLERAVEQLQKRNAELEAEVSSLKKQTASVPEGKMKTKVSYDGKSYVEKAVVEEEKAPLFVLQRGSELKLVLGGFIQANFEGGDVSAFEGRFGQTALDDRFRLRRARINLTGEFAEQFDFKIEGEFENSDGLNIQPHRFFGNRHFRQLASISRSANQDRAMESAVRVGAAYSRPFPDHNRAQSANRGDHAGAADRRSALGKALHERLA